MPAPIGSISTVLLDLDGVIVHFDKSKVPRLEEQHGLEPGTLRSVAFAPALLDLAITGKITRAEWTRRVGEAAGSVEAAAEWLGTRGTPDPAMLAIVADLRRQGMIVAVLTNGTNTVAEEAEQMGIAHTFDAIFSTAHIGYAKPDRRAFAHVCRTLGVAPDRVFFTDDSESKLQGAIDIGMHVEHFVGVDQFIGHLAELGLNKG